MLALFKKSPTALPPKRELINTCAKCSMSKFVDAIVNGNTDGLQWDAIFNEYLTISGDTHISTILELMKSITMVENRLTLIQLMVDRLSEGYYAGFAEQLRAMGFNFSYEDGPQLMAELEATVTRSKQLLIQLNQDKAELEQLRKDQGSGKATVQDYEMQYSAIEEFKGVAIDPETYSVSRYVADIKRMKERYKP